MNMQTFIGANRQQIDEVINSVIYRWNGNGGRGTVPNPPPRRNDEERKQWVLNEEGLYNWARSEGCKI